MVAAAKAAHTDRASKRLFAFRCISFISAISAAPWKFLLATYHFDTKEIKRFRSIGIEVFRKKGRALPSP
jgi:hypothetical protein